MGEAVGADTGVVEQHVDAPEPLDGSIDRGADRGVVAHVADEGEAFGTEFLARAGQRAEVVFAAERVAGIGERPRDVEGRDPVARGGERERGGAPLPVGGAGDEGDARVGAHDAPPGLR